MATRRTSKQVAPALTDEEKKRIGVTHGFRSGLEERIGRELVAALGCEVKYEDPRSKIKYMIPAREATYTPDFVLPNGIIVETKGWFKTEDRKKHKLIREQLPHLDIRLVFNNPSARISKKSATTYAKWCETLGIKFAAKSVPEAWLKESPKK